MNFGFELHDLMCDFLLWFPEYTEFSFGCVDWRYFPISSQWKQILFTIVVHFYSRLLTAIVVNIILCRIFTVNNCTILIISKATWTTIGNKLPLSHYNNTTASLHWFDYIYLWCNSTERLNWIHSSRWCKPWWLIGKGVVLQVVYDKFIITLMVGNLYFTAAKAVTKWKNKVTVDLEINVAWRITCTHNTIKYNNRSCAKYKRNYALRGFDIL